MEIATPEVQILEKPKIRKHFDVTTRKWYFSVVDVIGTLTNTKDARNYWKVLKNRLKKSDPELVTKCNRLKMKAKDGKYYLTDAADSDVIIHIIENIPKASVEAFRALVLELEDIVPNLPKLESPTSPAPELKKDIPEKIEEKVTSAKIEIPEEYKNAEAKLLVDAEETPTNIFIKAFLAGVDPEDIHIYVEPQKVFIYGKRERIKNSFPVGSTLVKNYLREELDWISFSREIILPSPVLTEDFNKAQENGILKLELFKI